MPSWIRARLLERCTIPQARLSPTPPSPWSMKRQGSLWSARPIARESLPSPRSKSAAIRSPSPRRVSPRPNKKGLVVNASARIQVPITLAGGSVTQTVEVTTDPAALQTDNSSTGATIPAAAIVQTPLVTRNPIFIAQLTPGVAPAGVSTPNVRNRTPTICELCVLRYLRRGSWTEKHKRNVNY
jgi:hypothetical protein